jgi:hypothetical protein
MVFEKRMLRRIFEPKREEVEKLHNKKLRNLYLPPSIIRIIKSRRMKWAGHITGMGRGGMLIGHWCKDRRK